MPHLRRTRPKHVELRPALAVVCALLQLAAASSAAAAGPATNVLLVVVDNLRPAIGAYGDASVVTPTIDAFAAQSALFAGAHCQVAWCAPSRNSFLSGRRPQVTRALNFLDSFREAPGAEQWVTLPGAFKASGFYTTGVGKVFHPNLPPAFDFPASWSDAPVCPTKEGCPGATMSCPLPPSRADADVAAIDELLARLGNSSGAGRPPFFAAIGFQSPRLPWVYPAGEAARYPPAGEIPIAQNRSADGLAPLEWFRPTEVDQYSDVRNVSHGVPMADALQHEVRRAYYAAVSHVDTQLSRVLAFLDARALSNSTVVAIVADHGQALGERNLWSMMSLLDASTQVPFMIRLPVGSVAPPRVYGGPVELVDLMPTLMALAGLPPAPPEWALPGVDLSPFIRTGAPVAKDAAFSQISRCTNCSLAYGNESGQCAYDAAVDAAYSVPCALAPAPDFDVMGMSIRTADFRYSAYCAWDGASLAANFSQCSSFELFDHRGESGVAPYFRPDGELVNVVDEEAFADVRDQLHARLEAQFSS